MSAAETECSGELCCVATSESVDARDDEPMDMTGELTGFSTAIVAAIAAAEVLPATETADADIGTAE